jgi:hypothetical protein
MARVACRAEVSPRAGVASHHEGLFMSGRPSPARPLPTVRRGHEFSRLQQQLLTLAYEQLLPIIHHKRRPTTAAARRSRSQAVEAVTL